jgi:hypothetical protein
MGSDFSKGKRGAVVKAAPGKEKITIRLDTFRRILREELNATHDAA